MIGPCYGSDTSNPEKNYKRGMNSIRAGHGRVLEYADVWFILDGYSARVIREFYTHVGGAPTRTQASTRYINESDFEYYIPDAIDKNMSAVLKILKSAARSGKCPEAHHLEAVRRFCMLLEDYQRGIRRFRKLSLRMKDLLDALGEYSEEWKTLVDEIMKCKCDKASYCLEEFSCGKYPKKENLTDQKNWIIISKKIESEKRKGLKHD